MSQTLQRESAMHKDTLAGLIQSNLSKTKQAPQQQCLQTPSTAATLPPCGVGGDRRDVLDAANLDAGASQSTQCRLRARARRLRLVAACGTQLDVQRCDAQLLQQHDRTARDANTEDVVRKRAAVSVGLHAAAMLWQ